jgi:ATP-binding cassette subfamily C protein/ATP-binding cassette subfamily C protein LapB
MIVNPLIRSSVAKAGRSSSRRQELVVETLNTMRAVKYCGAERTWLERYRALSAKAALSSFLAAQLSSLLQTGSHVLMTGSGIATIIFGVYRVVGGGMTVGELVATMILVWRVLSPLQSVFVSLTRLTQIKSSITQINNLMNLRGEREAYSLVTPLKRFSGAITFNRVSLQYTPESDPALVGVSFDVSPGEIVAVVGGNGSGKSTILKIIAGIYNPQSGNVRIDNMDIRQMDVIERRHAVSYVPQTLQFFYGTIAQNLRLAHPVATEEDLRWACAQAGVLDDVMKLEQGSGKWRRSGFEVRIGDTGAAQMPVSLLQRLNLARGYLKRAPIMLFDEPGNGLDFPGDQRFMQTMEGLRGHATALIVTHRPSHLRIADKIVWLEAGHVRAFGPAAEMRKQLPKDLL